MASERPSFAAAWLSQRKSGEAAIASIEAEELRKLGPEQALRLADALLAATPLDVPRPVSGLVEQQRWFARAVRR
jgi:hypothetical protein